MRPALIGGVFVGRELKFGAVAPARSLQQTPVGFVLEFGEIGDCRLRFGYRRRLVCADICGDALIDSIG